MGSTHFPRKQPGAPALTPAPRYPRLHGEATIHSIYEKHLQFWTPILQETRLNVNTYKETGMASGQRKLPSRIGRAVRTAGNRLSPPQRTVVP